MRFKVSYERAEYMEYGIRESFMKTEYGKIERTEGSNNYENAKLPNGLDRELELAQCSTSDILPDQNHTL